MEAPRAAPRNIKKYFIYSLRKGGEGRRSSQALRSLVILMRNTRYAKRRGEWRRMQSKKNAIGTMMLEQKKNSSERHISLVIMLFTRTALWEPEELHSFAEEFLDIVEPFLVLLLAFLTHQQLRRKESKSLGTHTLARRVPRGEQEEATRADRN
jgi:hypothetical protein